MRGLEITPTINPYRTGIDFTINPGALIHDLTYFELPLSNVIEMDDVINFPGQYVVIYTNWKYIHTVYDNPLKIEATFYNPATRRALTGWDSTRNRVILGVYSYEIIDNTITFVQEEQGNLYFEDSNVISNGLFDERSFKFWTAINSTLHIQNTDGVADTPYLQVTPIAENYQGIGQVIPTKMGYNYELSFYVRSETLLPFTVIVRDGSSIYNAAAPELTRFNLVTPRSWTRYAFSFQAISTSATILFLKFNADLDSTFDIDSIFCLEYLESQKKTNINKISIIDGGVLGEISNVQRPDAPVLQKITIDSKPNERVYDLKGIESAKGNFVFYDADKLDSRDYSIEDEKLTINFDPYNNRSKIDVVVFGSRNADPSIMSSWSIQIVPGTKIYRPQERFKDPSLGQYFVFYGSNLLNVTDYAIDYTNNELKLSNELAMTSATLSIFYLATGPYKLVSKEWINRTTAGMQSYFLPDARKYRNGIYIVFYDANKLSDNDYTIDSNVLTLNFTPTESGVNLNTYFIGAELSAS